MYLLLGHVYISIYILLFMIPCIEMHKLLYTKKKKKILNINNEASVHFVNNTADCGGAVYLSNTAMNIGNNVDIHFCENKARKWHQVHRIGYNFVGGAVILDNSSLSTGPNAKLHFNSNSAGLAGGAVLLWFQSEIRLSSNTTVNFTSNVATDHGGAISMRQAKISITGDSVVHLFHNTASVNGGGALYLYYSQLFVQNLSSSLETIQPLVMLEEVFLCTVAILI